MNIITAYVIEVLNGPYYVDSKKTMYEKEHDNWWGVDVIYEDMGGVDKKTLRFDSEEKAKEVEKGYKFSH
jgi:hypothetical protein